jgi:predicted transcriptional regulator
MTTLTFRAPDAVSRKIRAAAKRRGMPVSRFIKEAAEREAARENAAVDYEPNETTAAAIREPIDTLTRYRTVDEALDSLKSDAKRRPKKPVSA